MQRTLGHSCDILVLDVVHVTFRNLDVDRRQGIPTMREEGGVPTESVQPELRPAHPERKGTQIKQTLSVDIVCEVSLHFRNSSV